MAAELVHGRYGGCDVFVHAAAMFAVEPFDDLGLDVWRWIQAVNVELAKRVGRNRVADLQLPTAGRCFPA